MVTVVDCHAGVLGSNPGGPKDFSLWNYFSDNLCKQFGPRSGLTEVGPDLYPNSLIIGYLYQQMTKVEASKVIVKIGCQWLI